MGNGGTECLSQGCRKWRGIIVRPLSFVELNMQKAKDTPMLFDHDVIKSIADAHGKTPAQVLLRWSTQRGVAVIPKSNNQSRLAQNLDVCSFDLKEDEIEKISALDKGLRFNNPTNVSVLLGYIGQHDRWLTFLSSTASTSPSLPRAITITYEIRENKIFYEFRQSSQSPNYCIPNVHVFSG